MENFERRYEKLPVSIFTEAEIASDLVAKQVAKLIRTKEQKGELCVLGLITGSTAVGVYEKLVRMHQEDNLSFKNVVVFNIDEYYPLAPDSLQSHYRHMYEYLFNDVDILPENIHLIPNRLPKSEIPAFCIR